MRRGRISYKFITDARLNKRFCHQLRDRNHRPGGKNMGKVEIGTIYIYMSKV